MSIKKWVEWEWVEVVGGSRKKKVTMKGAEEDGVGVGKRELLFLFYQVVCSMHRYFIGIYVRMYAI